MCSNEIGQFILPNTRTAVADADLTLRPIYIICVPVKKIFNYSPVVKLINYTEDLQNIKILSSSSIYLLFLKSENILASPHKYLQFGAEGF
jgi:hypothetical protein